MVPKANSVQHIPAPRAATWSNCVEVAEGHGIADGRGRRVLARTCVEPGHVLVQEPSFCAVLLPSHYGSHCHWCLEPCMVLLPCTGCCTTCYCSVQCAEAAASQYHDAECSIPLLPPMAALPLRAYLQLQSAVEADRALFCKLEHHFALLSQAEQSEVTAAAAEIAHAVAGTVSCCCHGRRCSRRLR